MILDAVIIAFVGFFVWRGLRKGLLLSFARLAGFVAATFAAVLGYRALASPLATMGLSKGTANLVSAVLLFVAVTALFWAGGRALTRLLDWTTLGTLNKAGGAFLAGVWATSLVTVVLLAVSVAPAQGLHDVLDRSPLARGIVREAPGFATSLARSDLRRFITSFVPAQELKVALVATSDFRSLEVAARELFDLANTERRARGLGPVRWDSELASAARSHAADMYLHGYFDHSSPDGSTPGARLKRRGISYRVTGENLALAPSTESVHDGFMRSSRHRRHILERGYTRLGVGVMYGRQGLLVAEEFAG